MDVKTAQKEILGNLVVLGRTGGMVNVIGVLKGATYQEAFDIANEMQNSDWIKIIYCSFNANIINVELTLKGKKIFEMI